MLSINRLTRKFGLNSKGRLIHLLAQVWAETGYLRLMRESGADSARYAPYVGRGLIQITWQDKYESYNGFAVLTPGARANFNLELIATDSYHAANSSGFYWVSKQFVVNETVVRENLSRIADDVWGTDSIGALCLWINGGANHYDHRHIHAFYIQRILDDVSHPIEHVVENIRFNRMEFEKAQKIVHGRSVSRIVGVRRSATAMNLYIDHTPQR